MSQSKSLNEIAGEIEAAEMRATVGPWTTERPADQFWKDRKCIDLETSVCLAGPSELIVEAVWHNDSTAGLYAKDDDLKLIAALRNHAPLIVAALRECEAWRTGEDLENPYPDCDGGIVMPCNCSYHQFERQQAKMLKSARAVTDAALITITKGTL